MNIDRPNLERPLAEFKSTGWFHQNFFGLSQITWRTMYAKNLINKVFQIKPSAYKNYFFGVETI